MQTVSWSLPVRRETTVPRSSRIELLQPTVQVAIAASATKIMNRRDATTQIIRLSSAERHPSARKALLSSDLANSPKRFIDHPGYAERERQSDDDPLLCPFAPALATSEAQQRDQAGTPSDGDEQRDDEGYASSVAHFDHDVGRRPRAWDSAQSHPSARKRLPDRVSLLPGVRWESAIAPTCWSWCRPARWSRLTPSS